MKILLADCETDGLDYTKIHCVSCKLWKSPDKVLRFTDIGDFEEYYLDTDPDKSAFHNGLGFDVKAINKLTSLNIDPNSVIDTQVVSKTLDYSRFNRHSLKELGEHLGVYKGDYSGSWDTYTEEMGDYCDQDVVVLEAIMDYFEKDMFDPKWSDALRLEHDMAIICQEMQDNGFGFNVVEARNLLKAINKEKKELEDGFQKAFPPKLVEVNRLKYRTTKDGHLFATVVKAMSKYPKTVVEGDQLVCYDYKEFNPGSPADRIDALWDAGWKPFEKTKGHINASKRRYLA